MPAKTFAMLIEARNFSRENFTRDFTSGRSAVEFPAHTFGWVLWSVCSFCIIEKCLKETQKNAPVHCPPRHRHRSRRSEMSVRSRTLFDPRRPTKNARSREKTCEVDRSAKGVDLEPVRTRSADCRDLRRCPGHLKNKDRKERRSSPGGRTIRFLS